MSDIKVRIYGEFNDKAFKKASKQTSALENSFKKLGGTLASVFAVGQIVAFGKASLKAFEDDQKAAARLAQTLKNLGLGFEDPRIEAYIKNLETTSGILDDQLRPALQSLLTTTGSVTKSQQLLSTAIDVSRGSGEDLTTVAQDLAQAYVGNVKGLKKYNLGLTNAELSGSSFNTILEKLNTQFAGQNAAYLETYSGKVSKLNVAFANMQETIGQGLADAFSNLAGDNGIDGAVKALEDFSQKLSDAIVGTSVLIDKLTSNIPKIGDKSFLSILMKALPGAGAVDFFNFLSNTGAKSKIAPKPFNVPMTVSAQTDFYAKQDAARKKAEEDAAKRAKALAALQAKAAKDALAKEKANQQLKRAGTVFDMQNIQIVAALQGKVSEEQRLRLTALLAINNDNADAADKLTQAILALQQPAFDALGVTITTADNATTIVTKLINAQTQLLLLNSGIANIPKAKNPFEDWDKVLKTIIDNLDTISSKIKNLPDAPKVGSTSTTSTTTVTTQGGTTTQSTGISTPAVGAITNITPVVGLTANDFGAGKIPLASITPIIPSGLSINDFGAGKIPMAALSPYFPAIASIAASFPQGLSASDYGYGKIPTAAMTPAPTVVVNVAGNVTTEKDLVSTITDQLYSFQRNGGQIQLSSLAV